MPQHRRKIQKLGLNPIQRQSIVKPVLLRRVQAQYRRIRRRLQRVQKKKPKQRQSILNRALLQQAPAHPLRIQRHRPRIPKLEKRKQQRQSILNRNHLQRVPVQRLQRQKQRQRQHRRIRIFRQRLGMPFVRRFLKRRSIRLRSISLNRMTWSNWDLDSLSLRTRVRPT